MPKRRGQASASSKHVGAPRTPPPLAQDYAVLNETPLSKKVSGATPYTSMHYKRDTRMKDLGTEMKGKFAGPISPSEFVQTFLPFKRGELEPMPGRRKKVFQSVADQRVETAMYGPMIAALKPYCPGFDLVDSHSHPDKSLSKNEPEIKPDVSLYISGCRRDPSIVTDISLIDIHMEFKLDPNDDPFRDHGTFENDSRQSADTKGQITSYTTKQLASQFRTHAFSVIICKDTARLMYWDRSGAVVTQSFSYVEEKWLATFFWRYTHSSRAVCGVDESVTAPTHADTAYIRKARVALELDDDTSFFKFAIYNEEGDISYCFGSKPWFKGNNSPTGRATRVFIVYDPVLERRVLMKDTWRVSLDGMQTEGAIYRRLHAANVSHIPRFLRGGDVTSLFCRTRSHKFARQFGLRLRPHSHYRLILDDIGRDLTSFTTTKELVETMAGALQAHTQAFENARILHRDISAGNIIISDRGGLLIDWDLSKDIEDLEKMSRQPFRTGTWQFIAARLLQARESAAHTPADDWESFFHVLSWVVLRFTKHGLDSAQLTHELRNTYDDWYIAHGKVYGGRNKAKSIEARFISKDARIPPGPLLDLLKDLVDVCAVRYEDPPPREDQDEYELFLQDVARDSSLERFADKYPFKRYQDRREKLKALWLVERFREAVNNQTWNMGPEGQRFENPLAQVDEVVITTKRPSEFEPDMPRQSKRFRPMVDSDDMDMGENISKEDVADVEEETHDDDLPVSALDEHELDDYAMVARRNEAETDWEGDEDNPVDNELLE